MISSGERNRSPLRCITARRYNLTRPRRIFYIHLAAAILHFVLDAVVDPFALSLPSHVPFHTAKNYTLSLAKQALAGKMDEVIKTIERNVRLV